VFAISQFRLLTAHYCLNQLSTAVAGGFVGAYLLNRGFSLPQALAAYAVVLLTRFGLRFFALSVVRRLGYRGAMILGAGLWALQFGPLLRADEPVWLAAWVLVVSVAESLYWPVYHAAAAVTGGGASRGRELGIRTALGTIVGVVGPLLGGFLLQRFGPAVDFGLAALVSAASALPIVLLGPIPAGPVPTVRESLRAMDLPGTITFAADGWMTSGLGLAWPMVLFLSLGAHFEALGLANAVAGLFGAGASLICGRAIDRGGRDRYLVVVSCGLLSAFALRACVSWSPLAGSIANASGAALMGLYAPVVMSVLYERAKSSGAAYRFHFAAEAGWDMGAASGCLAGAAVAWFTSVPSLALVPGALGVAVIYAGVRAQSHRLDVGSLAAEPVPS
jgi:hypothetical protein